MTIDLAIYEGKKKTNKVAVRGKKKEFNSYKNAFLLNTAEAQKLNVPEVMTFGITPPEL